MKNKNRKIGLRPSALDKIIGAPLTALEDIKQLMKFSIRTKISISYLIIFTFIFSVTTGFLVAGYIYSVKTQLYEKNFDVVEQVLSLVSEEGLVPDVKDHLSRIYIDQNIGVLIQDRNGEESYANSPLYPIVNYDSLKGSGFFKDIFPLLDLASYELMPLEFDLDTDGKATFFFEISGEINLGRRMCAILGICYFVGLMVMFLFGGIKTKQVISPINMISQTADNINSQNLDARIDVGKAKYELKDLAITINEMIDRIQDGYKKQQRFVSDVSHELRTPISVIDGYANMLDRWGKKDPEILQESIDALKNEAANMGNLVERLLFLARYDRDVLKYEIKSCNISEIIEEVAKETQMIDSDHKVNWLIEPNLYVLGDCDRIKQVARIFADNAVKYTPKGKHIDFGCFVKEGYAAVEVKDSGIGIEKKDLESIFERFYRADESRNKQTGGYGLGLSIAKIIVLQHKGKIKVKTKINRGSIFSAYFPLQKNKTP
ncbi:HAMP domain-containing sensor histidine kinase [Alkalibacter mobilis]|uniref:HAMP domain-containing sensor histidine kinase n=1 Tax=Alkalibacter mobilis TaxID=2787712 RepID=UPI00189FED15|nr:ATP-binding protein [Alkalibacter mobilis]